MYDSLSQKYVDVTQINPFSLPSVPLEGRNNLPEVSGIYFAVLETGEILYIGKSVCIRERWAAHHKLDELRPYSHARIAWFVYPARSDEDLVELEKACISHFSPALNYTMKRGKRLEASPLNSPVEPVSVLTEEELEALVDRRKKGRNIFEKTHERLTVWVLKSKKKKFTKLAKDIEVSQVELMDEALTDLFKKYRNVPQ